MANTYPRREYFLVYPPLDILEVYALEHIIDQHLPELKPHLVNSEIHKSRFLVLNHNVRVSEHELAHWCARMDLGHSLLCEDNILAEYCQELSTMEFPETVKTIHELHQLVRLLDFGSAILDGPILIETMAQCLRRLVYAHRRFDHPQYDAPHKLTRRSIDEYFDWFPLEEIRLPIVAAIHGARKAGGVYWTSLEARVYGEALPKGQVRKPLWLEGETWKDTIEPDDDDKEPWM